MNDEPGERDLATIRRLMEDAQRGVPDAGAHFIIWGVAIALALGLTYATVAGAVVLPVGVVWAVSLAVGWGLAMWVARRQESRAPVQTLLARVVAGIWVGCGVSATLAAVLGYYAAAIPLDVIPGAVALIMGAGYFASSFAYQIVWMRLVAVGWWLGATGMLLRPGPSSLIVMTALVLVLQIVPGIVLCRRQRATPEA